jgi:hypothetical protein
MLAKGQAKKRGLFACVAVLLVLVTALIPTAGHSQNNLPSSASATGTLVLRDVTPPGAIVTLDGKQVGPAKGFRQELAAGPHEIEVSANGYVAAKKTVVITAGRTLAVSLRLAAIAPKPPRMPPVSAVPPPPPVSVVSPPPPPTKGTLALDVTPPGAVVTLDGKQIRSAKGFHQELAAGPHDIEISADGYTATKETVMISAGETLRLPLRLIPEPPPTPTRAEPTPPTNSELTQMQALRKRLEQLPQVKIYLDAPIAMKVSDRRSVDARVGVSVPDDILKGHTRVGDQTAEATVRVSHEMIATLSGPGFKITRTTPEKQTVAEGFPTVWQWEIEAKQDGVKSLRLRFMRWFQIRIMHPVRLNSELTATLRK